MRTSEQLNELAGALSKAQGEIKDAAMDSKNPHFKSEFASLESCFKEIRPVFSKYDLSFVQFPESDEHGPVLTTRLMHKSGQWMEGSLGLILTKNDMQGIGSATTYARRYSIQSVAGINQERDDDGQSIASSSNSKNLQNPPIPQGLKPKNTAPVGGKEVAEIVQLAEAKGLRGDDLKEFIFDNFKITSSRDMQMWQYELAKDILRRKVDLKPEVSQ